MYYLFHLYSSYGTALGFSEENTTELGEYLNSSQSIMKSLKPVTVGPKAGKYSYVMFHNKAECRTNKIQPEIFSCPIGD